MSEMEEEVFTELEARAKEAFVALGRELAKLRTGRANVGLLDHIKVDYYGTLTPLNQLATLATPEPRLLTVKPWDKGARDAIIRALSQSDLGITPNADAEIIRLPIPQLTEERRREMVKTVRRHGEECKVAVRSARREANEMLKELKKDGEISEDDLHRDTERVQKATDGHVAKVDELAAKKEKELLEI
jgi:ribosome recycling factor